MYLTLSLPLLARSFWNSDMKLWTLELLADLYFRAFAQSRYFCICSSSRDKYLLPSEVVTVFSKSEGVCSSQLRNLVIFDHLLARPNACTHAGLASRSLSLLLSSSDVQSVSRIFLGSQENAGTVLSLLSDSTTCPSELTASWPSSFCWPDWSPSLSFWAPSGDESTSMTSCSSGGGVCVRERAVTASSSCAERPPGLLEGEAIRRNSGHVTLVGRSAFFWWFSFLEESVLSEEPSLEAIAFVEATALATISWYGLIVERSSSASNSRSSLLWRERKARVSSWYCLIRSLCLSATFLRASTDLPLYSALRVRVFINSSCWRTFSLSWLINIWSPLCIPWSFSTISMVSALLSWITLNWWTVCSKAIHDWALPKL